MMWSFTMCSSVLPFLWWCDNLFSNKILSIYIFPLIMQTCLEYKGNGFGFPLSKVENNCPYPAILVGRKHKALTVDIIR